MKTFSVALLAICLPLVAFAQTKDSVKPNADTEKAVMKIEQDMSAALTKPDAAAAESMLAESFYVVNPDGTTQTKAQFVADMKSGDLKLESNKLDDMKVQAADADMAVVTYRSNDKGSYKGQDISGQYRWTDVLTKRDGRWLFVVSQGTKVETKP
jgi:hypothetical protein